MGGGQPIPNAPHLDFWAVNGISELLFIAFTTRKIQILPASIRKPISSYTGWGQHPIYLLMGGGQHPSWFTLPPTQVSDWLHSIWVGGNLKWYPSWFTLQSPHVRRWVGGNLSQLVYLAPHLDFWAVMMDSELLLIAVTTTNGYVSQNEIAC